MKQTKIYNYGEKPIMAWLDISLLSIDKEYQRDITGERSKKNIEYIVSNFCWEKFTPITVVERGNGLYNIIDGQHRYNAALRLGNIPQLPCWIIKKTSIKEQAETFMGINKNRVFTNPYDLYKAKIAAEDKDALMIDAFCNKAGIIIPFNGYCSNPCMTLALKTIQKHLNLHNDIILIEAINIIKEAFPDKCGQLKADILNTLVCLKIEYGAKIKDKDMIAALVSFETVDKISAKARELKALDSSLSASESHMKIFLSKLKEVRKQ